MKFQDSIFNGSKVTVDIKKSVTDARTDERTDEQ